MKKYTIKLCSLALALVMCLCVFGCGKKESDPYLGVVDYIIDSDSVLRLNAETTQASLDALTVGDIITLGTYDLDNNSENAGESLTWKVLAIENGKALVVSEICVDAGKFNTDKEDTTWETSDIRAWLNEGDSSFYATAFGEDEKSYILLSDVENDTNAAHDIEGGNDTEDYMFLLSFEEAEQYFENDEARIAKASAKAVANGGQCFDSRTKSEALNAPESADEYMALSWWLRSPGESAEKAANVLYFGQVNPMGARADLSVRGIRPAMWVRTVNEVLPEEIYSSENWASVSAGDKVSFGAYEQDGDTSAKEEIIWQVLKVEDGKATMISEKVLDRVLYYDFEYSTAANAGATNWESSDLRAWLNGEFKNTFTEDELALMTAVTLKNPANALTGVGGCADTEDLVYALSTSELKALVPNALDRKAEATDYAASNGVYVDAQTRCSGWWLRDAGDTSNLARNVFYYGGIDTEGKLVKNDYVGVRPVITVDINK